MMRVVDFLYFGSLTNAAVGPVKNMKILRKNNLFFKKSKYDINFFDNKGLYVDDTYNVEIDVNIPRSQAKKYLANLSCSFLGTSLLFYIYFLRHAKAMINNYLKLDRRPDIIYMRDIFSAYYITKEDKFNDIPKVLALANNGDGLKMLFDNFPKLNFIEKFLRKKEAYIYENVSSIVLLSNNAKEVFKHTYNDKYLEKIDVSYNGLDDFEYSFKKERKVKTKLSFVTTGSICKRKGHDLIVKAVGNLPKDKRKLFQIYFLGDGALAISLKKMCTEMDLNDVIIFNGQTKDVNRILCESDFYIQVSRDEGMPMALIEALRAGLPSIGTKVAAIPEMIVNNKNGFLINNESVIELSSSILKMLSLSKVEKKKFSVYSRKIFEERFLLTRTMERLINIFDKIKH